MRWNVKVDRTRQAPDLRREEIIVFIAFLPSFFSPAETDDVTIGFEIAVGLRGKGGWGRWEGSAVRRQKYGGLGGGGNPCSSQCVCHFCVSESFERTRE